MQNVTESARLLFNNLFQDTDRIVIAMNVLRMVKLFGWERKMNDKIAGKREEELKYIKKRQMLDLLNGSLK